MKFQVQIAPAAIADAIEAHAYIAADSPSAADRWFVGLMDAIDSLASHPKRCPRAPESRARKRDIRHLLYKSHRVLFTIVEDEVRVLHVHHAARQPQRLK